MRIHTGPEHCADQRVFYCVNCWLEVLTILFFIFRISEFRILAPESILPGTNNILNPYWIRIRSQHCRPMGSGSRDLMATVPGNKQKFQNILWYSWRIKFPFLIEIRKYNSFTPTPLFSLVIFARDLDTAKNLNSIKIHAVPDPDPK